MSSGNEAHECPLCGLTWYVQDYEEHLEDAHPNHENIRMMVDDEPVTLLDYAAHIGGVPYVPHDEDYVQEYPAVPNQPNILIEFDSQKIANSRVDASGFASTLTISFLKRILDHLSPLINNNAKIDKEDFLPKYMMLLVLSDATDKVTDFGEVELISENFSEMEELSGHQVSAGKRKVPWQQVVNTLILAAKQEHFILTQRIVAKTLGPLFRLAIFEGTLFNDLKRTGTPQSKKLGVPNELFYTVLSFFSSIKDVGSWTRDEFTYYRAKQTNSRMSQWGIKPGNLMPFVVEDTREQTAPPSSVVQERDANSAHYQYWKNIQERDESEQYGAPGITPGGPSTPTPRRF